MHVSLTVWTWYSKQWARSYKPWSSSFESHCLSSTDTSTECAQGLDMVLSGTTWPTLALNLPFISSNVGCAVIHFVYGFCGGNAAAAVEDYQRQFPKQRNSDRYLFDIMHEQLQESRSFTGVLTGMGNPRRRNKALQGNIMQMIQCDLRTSTQRIAARLHTMHMTV